MHSQQLLRRSHKLHVWLFDMSSPEVLNASSAHNAAGVQQFSSKVADAIASETPVAFDCEGIDLCRAGTVEVISIAFKDGQVFLVDMQALSESSNNVFLDVKKLFESENVTKIVHDCRMDCDALYHIHRISVVNLHDTSCFHEVISSQASKNLNDVLEYNGLSINAVRDCSVYRTNPRYWAARPLTSTMIQWASQDVGLLHAMAGKQLVSLMSFSSKLREGQEKSKQFSLDIVNRSMAVRPCRVSVGGFIGARGKNIFYLQRQSDTLIYQARTANASGTQFRIFYTSARGLATVNSALGN